MLIAVGLLVLAIVLLIALQVDDWSRDLSTNRAATSSDASDPLLRTLELSASADEIRKAVDQFVERSAAWTASENSNAEAGENSILLVRKTRWLGFADEAQVFLQPTEAGTQVDIASQSRVGRGDLGQNPRNLRELTQMLHDAFDSQFKARPIASCL